MRGLLPGRDEPGSAAAGDPAARIDRHRLLLDALVGVPEPYRTALLNCEFEGMPREELAWRLGVPVDAVEARLRRGMALLAEQLGSR
ncbi:MAG TPA: sigma factor-like helix-turn-helix DNA-binding protein [Planctomycetota bacterium]|nr:sigma factor-like helix-turn-helix DNA-binding protein [Planctomycetota bacterium]